MKKAIPGASWDGSRFLSRSATATCCERSKEQPTPTWKAKASIRLGSNFLPSCSHHHSVSASITRSE